MIIHITTERRSISLSGPDSPHLWYHLLVCILCVLLRAHILLCAHSTQATKNPKKRFRRHLVPETRPNRPALLPICAFRVPRAFRALCVTIIPLCSSLFPKTQVFFQKWIYLIYFTKIPRRSSQALLDCATNFRSILHALQALVVPCVLPSTPRTPSFFQFAHLLLESPWRAFHHLKYPVALFYLLLLDSIPVSLVCTAPPPKTPSFFQLVNLLLDLLSSSCHCL